MKQIFFNLFFLIQVVGFAQGSSARVNLEKEWLIYTDSGYTAFQEQDTIKAIYIPFGIRTGTGAQLEARSTKSLTIFLNNTLLVSGEKFYKLSIDSLRTQYNLLAFTLTFYSDHISTTSLSTHLRAPVLMASTDVLTQKPPTFFRDFVFVASFVILLILLIIIRLNPKLASDYFSVTKIFSLRESEDSIVYTRITSSGNFLFYGFSSLTLGFFMLIIFTQLPQKQWLGIDTFQQAVLSWFLLSAIITLLFFAKMVIIYVFATLFNLREVAGMQFFNWVRLLFLTVGFSVSLLVCSIIIRNGSPAWFQFFYVATGWLLMLWVILAFFKIAAKARIGLFHLFSYLCATEIIPSLIILKILYY